MRGVAAGESIVMPVLEGQIAADLRVPEQAIGLVITSVRRARNA